MTPSQFTSRAALTLAAAVIPGCMSTWISGQDSKDEFVDSVEVVQTELSRHEQTMQAMLDAYASIVDAQTENPVRAYEELTQSLDRFEEQVDELGDRIDRMESTSESFFDSWQADFDKIETRSLRQRSQDRLIDVRTRYGDLFSVAQPTHAQAENWLASLRDQALFLRHDLTPESVAMLSDDATVLREEGAELVVIDAPGDSALEGRPGHAAGAAESLR